MNLTSKLEKYLADKQMVGCTAIIADKNQIIDYALIGNQTLNAEKTSLNTIYRIASISKIIVAMTVMTLYDEGKIDIEADISNYLGFTLRNPNYPNDVITTKMVMTQTSSISDSGVGTKGYDGVNQVDDYVKLEELFYSSNYFNANTYSKNKPGTVFEYSNLGCGILACLVERITKERFVEVVKERILKPLDILSGFRLEDLAYPENLASHYLFYDNKFTLYRNYQKFLSVQSPKYPIGDNFRGVAGGLYISGQDLTKIMQMLINKGTYHGKQILKPSTVELMEQVHWSGVPSDPTYRAKGLQMIIMNNFTKAPLYGHFGNAYGLRSFMLYSRELEKGIIFLCNGANFITDEEHMTILQEQIINIMVDCAKMR